MPYNNNNKDPKRDHNFDNHPYCVIVKRIFLQQGVWRLLVLGTLAPNTKTLQTLHRPPKPLSPKALIIKALISPGPGPSKMLCLLNCTVEARKLEHHYPQTLKGKAKGILALIILNQLSGIHYKMFVNCSPLEAMTRRSWMSRAQLRAFRRVFAVPGVAS